MSQVKGRDTKPELAVRSTLHKLGYRYRLHREDLPGTPDIVFPSRGKVILVNGCFWHGHNCKFGRSQPKTNVEFWSAKIEANRGRDKRNIAKLRRYGWRVMVIWECRIKKEAWVDAAVRYLEQ